VLASAAIDLAKRPEQVAPEAFARLAMESYRLLEERARTS
jgi:hypothetical protein